MESNELYFSTAFITLKHSVARWLRCLHCRLTARRPGFDSRMGRCWLWGAGSPQTFSGLSPRPFCVEFACSPRFHKGFPPLRTTTVKTCKLTEFMSIHDQRWTVHFTWSPGAAKLPTAPGGSLRKDGPGWEICTCVFQCVVCAIKNLTKVLIIIIIISHGP